MTQVDAVERTNGDDGCLMGQVWGKDESVNGGDQYVHVDSLRSVYRQAPRRPFLVAKGPLLGENEAQLGTVRQGNRRDRELHRSSSARAKPRGDQF